MIKKWKSIFKESLLDKGKFLRKEKDYILIAYPYNFGDLKLMLRDDLSDTAVEILDELNSKFKKEFFISTAEKVRNTIEIEFNEA